jgi:hypothetical protein
MRQASQAIHDEHDNRSATIAVEREAVGERIMRHDFILRKV